MPESNAVGVAFIDRMFNHDPKVNIDLSTILDVSQQKSQS